MQLSTLVLFTFLAVSSAAPVTVSRDVAGDLETRAPPLSASQILGFNKANGLNQAAQAGANAPITSLANLAKTAITTLLSPGPKLGRAELEELDELLRRGLSEAMEHEARAPPVPASQILGFNKANGLNQAANAGANAPLTSLANLAKTAITTLLSPGPKLGRAELEELDDLLRRSLSEAMEHEARAPPLSASQILSFNKANGLNQAAQKGANAPLTSLANLAKTAITTLLSPGPKLGRAELDELEARAPPLSASQILSFNKANGLNQAAQKGANAPITSLANLAKTAITTLLSPGPKLGRAELAELEARAPPLSASQILGFNKANGLNQAAQKGANAPLTSLANLAKTAITTVLSPGPKIPRDELEEIHYMVRKSLEAAVNELD